MSVFTMEHLRVCLVNGLPQRLERVADGGYRSAFLIPKASRMEVLQFIKSQPQHIVKHAKTFIEVLGYLPERARAVGAGAPNAHCDFVNLVRQALQFAPTHDLARLSITDLKKYPSVKALIFMKTCSRGGQRCFTKNGFRVRLSRDC